MSELRSMVARCLMAGALLTNKKRQDIDEHTVDAWTAHAESHGLLSEEFKAAFESAVDICKFFPSWGEVWTAHRKGQRALGGALVDPVLVDAGEPLGPPTIGERARRDAKGLGYTELRKPEGPKALPSPKAREVARERLNVALKKLGSKNRMPEFRVRAKKETAHDDGFKARRNAQVEAVKE